MNQPVIVEYPCGCRWQFLATVQHLPRNCPEHWVADKGFKLSPTVDPAPEESDAD